MSTGVRKEGEGKEKEKKWGSAPCAQGLNYFLLRLKKENDDDPDLTAGGEGKGGRRRRRLLTTPCLFLLPRVASATTSASRGRNKE